MYVLLLVTLLVCCSAQQFQCNFVMQTGQNAGFFNGVLNYDWANKRTSVTYTKSAFKEVAIYNSTGGYPASTSDGRTQTVSQWSTDCTCSSSVSSLPQPIMFVDTTYLTAQGQTYVPKNLASGLKSITFGTDGFPTTAVWSDGKTFTYSNCKNQVFDASVFATPAGCSCNKPIDVVLVLDRSCSIDKTEFVQEKAFTTSLVGGFNVGRDNTNIGITNFHTWTWDGPVSITEGTGPSQVQTGASALQCWDGTNKAQQCLVNTGSNPDCCGCGTCISCGIVNGADMLATSTRKSASKILIVLTDGYHNLVLNKNGDNLNRDSRGKPNGLKYTVGSKTCSEQDSSLTDPCYQGLTADLQWAVNYAKTKVPGVQIFAIGVGDVWKQHQLEVIADGKTGNVLGTKDWNKLTSLVADITKLVCPVGTQCPTGCCGFCACATSCVMPDGCTPGNLCYPPSGPCCAVPTTVDTTVCSKSDKCFTYKCDPALEGGKGGCSSTALPPTPNSTCTKYTCDPATGKPRAIAAPGEPCDTNDKCVSNLCDFRVPGDATTMYCKTTSKKEACIGTDKCFKYDCDPLIGCTNTSIVPKDNCTKYTCDPKTGAITSFTPVECCTNTCDDKNECTIDSHKAGDCSCVFTPRNCTGGNKCVDYGCDPKVPGGCTAVPVNLPKDTQCDHYQCDPATGVVTQKDLCCRNKTCDDQDLCTVDVRDNCTCTFTPKSCTPDPNKCMETDCDPKKGCVSKPKEIPKDTKCELYVCDPATGVVSKKVMVECCPTCTPTDKCQLCSPKNITCEPEYRPRPESDCIGNNKCKTYWCDPKIGCTSKDNDVPEDTCLHYICDPLTGNLTATPRPNICDDHNECTTESCELGVPGDILSARCVYKPVVCQDNNACTTDSCDPKKGCVYTPFDPNFCDDHNLCTTDACDPASTNLTYPCTHTNITCNDTDVCHEVECRPLEGCVETQIICPVTDNCTISGCNATDDLGCYIESAGVCGAPVSAVAGLAGGVIAGIVAAALAGTLVTSGGAVTAFGQGAGAPLNAAVRDNPLYEGGGNQGYNPLHRV